MKAKFELVLLHMLVVFVSNHNTYIVNICYVAKYSLAITQFHHILEVHAKIITFMNPYQIHSHAIYNNEYFILIAMLL